MNSDDEITLSSYALEALEEFKKEEKERLNTFQALYDKSETDFKSIQKQKILIDLFQEDWQLSQFWYSDETSKILAKALLHEADHNTIIVIASAPAVYAAIQNLDPQEVPTEHIYLMEFDDRFKLLAGNNFFQYDYNKPNDIPDILRNKCHRLLIDPPFLEAECQDKSAIAARNLLFKDENLKTINGFSQFKLITSTGERMADVVKRNYPELKVTNFYPEHKNGLSNEFRCYASFECEFWKFQ